MRGGPITGELVALEPGCGYTMRSLHATTYLRPSHAQFMQDPLLIALISTGALLTGALAYALWQSRKHAERVEQLQSRATARLDKLDTEHTKQVKRLTREWEGQKKRAHLDLARDLLPAIDAVESALAGADPDDDMTEGVEMIRRELLETFRAHDIERLAPEPGDPFDPELHEAVDVAEPSDNVPAGTVAMCHRAGYRHPESVLRPAMVTVARD